jgi:hypothetical protein
LKGKTHYWQVIVGPRLANGRNYHELHEIKKTKSTPNKGPSDDIIFSGGKRSERS